MRDRRGLFTFPNPVDERAARTVALGVVLLTALTMATQWQILLIALVYGFTARVAAGPRFSPLGLLATRVVVPRLSGAPRLTPGPPKRFAQAIGLMFSSTALVLAVAGQGRAAGVVLLLLLLAASLEAFLGICLGCRIFAVGMRVGLIPGRVCVACADLSRRQAGARP